MMSKCLKYGRAFIEGINHNRESGRFGLGLSIVSAIIKMHGESYGVYNVEKGVCFWFTVKKSLK